MSVIDLAAVRAARGLTPPHLRSLPRLPWAIGDRVIDRLTGHRGTLVAIHRGPSGAPGFVVVQMSGIRRVFTAGRIDRLTPETALRHAPPPPASIRPGRRPTILFDDEPDPAA